MLNTPDVVQLSTRTTAVIRMTVKREQMAAAFPAAIQEVLAGIRAQGALPAGPLFARYLRMGSGEVEVEIGFPLERPIEPEGRLTISSLPGGRALRAVHRGPYEELYASWDQFGRWVAENGHDPDEGLWESYVTGPESSQDANEWRTELFLPLKS